MSTTLSSINTRAKGVKVVLTQNAPTFPTTHIKRRALLSLLESNAPPLMGGCKIEKPNKQEGEAVKPKNSIKIPKQGDIICCRCGKYLPIGEQLTQDGIDFYCLKCGEEELK